MKPVKTKIAPREIVTRKRFINPIDRLARFKSSDNYKNFKDILDEKIENEKKAKIILVKNKGNLSHENLRVLLDLVDKPYEFLYNGKLVSGSWFGRLLKCNTLELLKEDETKINEWFNILVDNNIPVVRKFTILRKDPYQISGLNAGFITLMLYLLDSSNYTIWFGSQHEGLRVFYPELEKYTGNSNQYLLFNEKAKEFAKRFSFEHAELDYVLTRILREVD